MRHLIRLTFLDFGGKAFQLKCKLANVGFLYILVTKATIRLGKTVKELFFNRIQQKYLQEYGQMENP